MTDVEKRFEYGFVKLIVSAKLPAFAEEPKLAFEEWSEFVFEAVDVVEVTFAEEQMLLEHQELWLEYLSHLMQS